MIVGEEEEKRKNIELLQQPTSFLYTPYKHKQDKSSAPLTSSIFLSRRCAVQSCFAAGDEKSRSSAFLWKPKS